MQNDKNDKSFFGLDVSSKKDRFRLLSIIIGCWVLCAVASVLIFGVPCSAAEFGDLFGSVNALFSGLAFAGIIFTILLQREELEAQREELRLTRNEFVQQNKSLVTQRFENTFFSIYKIHNDTVASFEIIQHVPAKTHIFDLHIPAHDDIYRAKHIFQYLNRELSKIMRPLEATDEPTTLTTFRENFIDFYLEWEGQLHRYVDSLVCLIEYIKSSDLIDEKEKAQYSRIVQAHLTINERTVLYYYCLLSPRIKRNVQLWELMFRGHINIVDEEVFYSATHHLLIHHAFEEYSLSLKQKVQDLNEILKRKPDHDPN